MLGHTVPGHNEISRLNILPNELLLDICEYLPRHDLGHLAQSSTSIRALTAPFWSKAYGAPLFHRALDAEESPEALCLEKEDLFCSNYDWSLSNDKATQRIPAYRALRADCKYTCQDIIEGRLEGLVARLAQSVTSVAMRGELYGESAELYLLLMVHHNSLETPSAQECVYYLLMAQGRVLEARRYAAQSQAGGRPILMHDWHNFAQHSDASFRGRLDWKEAPPYVRESSLAVASAAGCVEQVRALLAIETHPGVPYQNRTPAQLAAHNGQIEILEILRQCYAESSLSLGPGALSAAVWTAQLPLLMKSAIDGHSIAATSYLLQQGLSLDTCFERCSARGACDRGHQSIWDVAVQSGKIPLVLALTRSIKDAELNASNKSLRLLAVLNASLFEREGLHQASQTTQTTLLQMLLTQTAIDAYAMDAHNNNIGHYAAIAGLTNIIDVLATCGFDFRHKNVQGVTALELAKHYGHNASVRRIEVQTPASPHHTAAATLHRNDEGDVAIVDQTVIEQMQWDSLSENAALTPLAAFWIRSEEREYGRSKPVKSKLLKPAIESARSIFCAFIMEHVSEVNPEQAPKQRNKARRFELANRIWAQHDVATKLTDKFQGEFSLTKVMRLHRSVRIHASKNAFTSQRALERSIYHPWAWPGIGTTSALRTAQHAHPLLRTIVDSNPARPGGQTLREAVSDVLHRCGISGR